MHVDAPSAERIDYADTLSAYMDTPSAERIMRIH